MYSSKVRALIFKIKELDIMLQAAPVNLAYKIFESLPIPLPHDLLLGALTARNDALRAGRPLPPETKFSMEKPLNISIIQTYVPTADSTVKDIDLFYELDKALNQRKNSGT